MRHNQRAVGVLFKGYFFGPPFYVHYDQNTKSWAGLWRPIELSWTANKGNSLWGKIIWSERGGKKEEKAAVLNCQKIDHKLVLTTLKIGT